MTKPLCKCHGASMLWNKDSRTKAGGWWYCTIAREDRRRQDIAANPTKYTRRKRRWYDKNKTRVRETNRLYRRKMMYGITAEDYEAMLRSQGDACAICGTTDPKPHGTFSVDHCHSTGMVRGLLCVRCNFMIGYARDNPDFLRNGVTYLEANEKRRQRTEDESAGGTHARRDQL